MSVNRVDLATPPEGVNPSGATGQVKKAGWLGRSISVGYVDKDDKEIKLNRGSLIDFLNAQGHNLTKGGYFWGGSSNEEIQDAFNNVKHVQPAVFALARNLKTANKFTSLNNVTLRNSYERKIILKEYIKIKWPKGPTAAELTEAFESIKSDLGYNLRDPGDLLNEIAECCNLKWVDEQRGEKKWDIHFVKPEVFDLRLRIKKGEISSLQGMELDGLDTNERRLVYKEFLMIESSIVDPIERRDILKEYIKMKFPEKQEEGPNADDLNKAFESIKNELNYQDNPHDLADQIAVCCNLKAWGTVIVKPEVYKLLFDIKWGNIASLKDSQLEGLDTNERSLVYQEFLKVKGPESPSIDPTEHRNILKEYIKMKFPEGPTADDLNKAFGSILNVLDNKYKPSDIANEIADCFNLSYSVGPRGEIKFSNRSESVP